MRGASSYHQQLSRGRKAGLTARELNLALSNRPVQGADQIPGQSDCNGYVVGINAQGHRTIRPCTETDRT